MARRTLHALRLGPAAQLIKEMADKETAGNFSEMCRKLLGEAIAARVSKNRGGH